MSSSRGIHWAAYLSLGAFTALWLARWPTFPLVLDPYYHLMVARQVVDAGGPITYEWWEYAPGGRWHLYPPLLHLLLAGLLKSGCSPLLTIRLMSAVLLPLLLASLFLVARRLLTPPIALACLVVGMAPFSFHLHSAITLAATLGLIELLWLMEALESGRPLAAGLLIALLFYTHLGLPWIALVTICSYSILRPSMWRTAMNASWGVLLALPWLVHLGRHLAFLHPVPRYENLRVELVPVLLAAALIGAWRCWRLKGSFLWLLACGAGFALLAPRHLYRWLSGEGMLPVILLAGVGVNWASQWCSQARRRARGGITGPEVWHHVENLVIILALFLSPTLARIDAGWRWRWPDSAPWHLVRSSAVVRKETDSSLYVPQIERLVREVTASSQPNDILWSNASYALGLIAALAHRPMSSAMLNEVSATASADPVRAAHLIIWFKFPQPGERSRFSQLSRYPLTRVAEDDLAIVFRQAGVASPARTPQAVLPLWVALLIVGVAVALICSDLRGR